MKISFYYGNQEGLTNNTTYSTRSDVLQGNIGGYNKTFKGQRNISTSCGYPDDISMEDYLNIYKRFGLAKRIVHIYPDECWRVSPRVVENEEVENTIFEEAWEGLVGDDNLRVHNKLWTLDRKAGLGRFGVLFLGFDDGAKDFTTPVVPKPDRKLLYLTPFDESMVEIKEYESDVTNPRFGMPTIYSIQMKSPDKMSGKNKERLVHHSRILHVAEDSGSNPTYGVPRLEAVYDNLLDIRKILGGAGEMFWRGGFPGFAFVLDPEADVEDDDLDDMKEQIQEYFHGLSRILRLQGMQVEKLGTQVSSPSDHLKGQYQAISAATGIPFRILIGSERGELASSKDQENWFIRVEQRQNHVVSPLIVKPFIYKMIEMGVLPSPANERFEVKWPSLYSLSKEEQAKVSRDMAESVERYSNNFASANVIPVKHFLQKVLGFDKEEVQQIVKDIDVDLEEEIRRLQIKEDTNFEVDEEKEGEEGE